MGSQGYFDATCSSAVRAIFSGGSGTWCLIWRAQLVDTLGEVHPDRKSACDGANSLYLAFSGEDADNVEADCGKERLAWCQT